MTRDRIQNDFNIPRPFTSYAVGDIVELVDDEDPDSVIFATARISEVYMSPHVENCVIIKFEYLEGIRNEHDKI